MAFLSVPFCRCKDEFCVSKTSLAEQGSTAIIARLI